MPARMKVVQNIRLQARAEAGCRWPHKADTASWSGCRVRSNFTSVNLCFLICEMGILMAPISLSCLWGLSPSLHQVAKPGRGSNLEPGASDWSHCNRCSSKGKQKDRTGAEHGNPHLGEAQHLLMSVFAGGWMLRISTQASSIQDSVAK